MQVHLSSEWNHCSFHHAVGGSAATMSELSLGLQKWTSATVPELCTQVGFVYVFICMCIEFDWIYFKQQIDCVCVH